ncbi:hypothetical protein K440DRAFT_657310 [Wilcoxina mikolae CBS 423.85]|nr:hypothetical protein K440DRAFT_657310 [Wilcoxina mikolae CBS 423.85]
MPQTRITSRRPSGGTRQVPPQQIFRATDGEYRNVELHERRIYIDPDFEDATEWNIPASYLNVKKRFDELICNPNCEDNELRSNAKKLQRTAHEVQAGVEPENSLEFKLISGTRQETPAAQNARSIIKTHTHSTATPESIVKTHKHAFPFCIFEAKGLLNGNSYQVENQAANNANTCLELLEHVARKPHDVKDVVRIRQYQDTRNTNGDRLCVFAVTCVGSQFDVWCGFRAYRAGASAVVLSPIWGGRITVFERARELLAIIKGIRDYVRKVYEPTICRYLGEWDRYLHPEAAPCLRERYHCVDLDLWSGEQVIDLDLWLDENEDVGVDVEMPDSQSYRDIPDGQDYYDAPSSPVVSPGDGTHGFRCVREWKHARALYAVGQGRACICRPKEGRGGRYGRAQTPIPVQLFNKQQECREQLGVGVLTPYFGDDLPL